MRKPQQLLDVEAKGQCKTGFAGRKSPSLWFIYVNGYSDFILTGSGALPTQGSFID